MKIISVRAPWWWWIVYGGKDIENRDWPTSYRGPVLIHASKWWQNEDVYDDFRDAKDMHARHQPSPEIPPVTLRNLRDGGGHIVGRANIIDCVTASASPWFVGKFGFVLANAAPVTPIPFKARLGLFDAPPDLLTAPTATRPSTPTVATGENGEKE